MLIAGPCAIENRDQIFKIYNFLIHQNVTHLRAQIFKGQIHPFDKEGKPAYWGIGDTWEGNDLTHLLNELQWTFQLPLVTEVQSIEQANFILHKTWIRWIQIGTRNCQNFPLLRHLAKEENAEGFILKRGLGCTVDEWIGSAEHLGGPNRVIMCERGVSHFDRTSTSRWRLDFNAVAFLKTYTNYRVIVDPSHGSGDRRLVYLLSKAALPIADGLMIEVHYEPDKSPTDASQTINFEEFKRIAELYRKE